MNELNVTGRVLQILPLQQGTSKAGKPWKSLVFVLETGGQYPKKVPIKLFGESVDKFPLQIGQEVTASLDLDGREWEGKWFPEIKAWNIVYAGAQQAAPAPQPTYQPPQPQPDYQNPPPHRRPPPPPPPPPGGGGVADDLPF